MQRRRRVHVYGAGAGPRQAAPTLVFEGKANVSELPLPGPRHLRRAAGPLWGHAHVGTETQLLRHSGHHSPEQ